MIFSLILLLDLLSFFSESLSVNPYVFHFTARSSPLGAHTLIKRTEVAVVISTATFNVVIKTYNLRNFKDYHLFINNRYLCV